MSPRPQLSFIYNAKSGKANAALDWAHKIISPNTYSCSLCSITYGNWGMKPIWKKFIEQLPYDVEFLYKDTFNDHIDSLNQNVELPIVAIKAKKKYRTIVQASELNELNSQEELIELLENRLSL